MCLQALLAVSRIDQLLRGKKLNRTSSSCGNPFNLPGRYQMLCCNASVRSSACQRGMEFYLLNSSKSCSKQLRGGERSAAPAVEPAPKIRTVEAKRAVNGDRNDLRDPGRQGRRTSKELRTTAATSFIAKKDTSTIVEQNTKKGKLTRSEAREGRATSASGTHV